MYEIVYIMVHFGTEPRYIHIHQAFIVVDHYIKYKQNQHITLSSDISQQTHNSDEKHFIVQFGMELKCYFTASATHDT